MYCKQSFSEWVLIGSFRPKEDLRRKYQYVLKELKADISEPITGQ